MKHRSLAIIFVVLILVGICPTAAAEKASLEDARRVCSGWVSVITQLKGHWAGSTTASIKSIQEFKRGDQVLGYFCQVKPKGYIVVSLFKELAPVRAYSTVGDLDAESDAEMADLLKGRMENILRAVGKKVGNLETVTGRQLGGVPETNYPGLWEQLENRSNLLKSGSSTDQLGLNYQGGKVLLASTWSQDWPWNSECPVPNPPCQASNLNGHVWAGCVATAAAQLMRYWSWPPYGEGSPYCNNYYAWTSMPDDMYWDSSPAEINAVGRLMHEAGMAVNMNYGCDKSSAFLSCWWAGCKSLEDALKENFRYNLWNTVDRSQYDTADEWFQFLKGTLNGNRPLPLTIPDHAVVIDGWQEIGSGPVVQQYHINYGWANFRSTWYTVDEIYSGEDSNGVSGDYVLRVMPKNDVSIAGLSGAHASSGFPYYYFSEDTTGSGASFASGLFLQFLPGVKVSCTGYPDNPIKFDGSQSAPTRLFTNGDTSKGIRIHGSTLKLHSGGAITIEPLGKPRHVQIGYISISSHISVWWEDGHGNQDGFYVERGVDTPSNWLRVGSLGANQTAFTDSGVVAGHTYYYRIRAFKGTVLSESSRVVELKI